MLKIFKAVFAKLIPKFPTNQHKYISKYIFEGLASILNWGSRKIMLYAYKILLSYSKKHYKVILRGHYGIEKNLLHRCVNSRYHIIISFGFLNKKMKLFSTLHWINEERILFYINRHNYLSNHQMNTYYVSGTVLNTRESSGNRIHEYSS